ncbi:MAG: NAD+ diphosphatase [Planctomycetota bacterium]
MIYYRELNIDRASQLRKNPEWLAEQWTRQQCRVFVINENKSLMHWPDRLAQTPRAVHFPRSEFSNLTDDLSSAVFLGLDEHGPLFGLDLTTIDDSIIDAHVDGSEFIDIRDVGWLLDHQDAAQIAYARALAYWNRYNQFCSSCGCKALAQDGGHVRRCSNDKCGRVYFPRTDPAVIMLVEDRSDASNPRCLLARNSRFPGRLMSTLAGFVDPLESLEETVAREVMEECGIEVDQVRYQASQPWPFPASIMLGFRANAVSTKIQVDGIEIEEADWFTADQLKDFGEWGDDGIGYCLPRQDSIARYLVNCWISEVG